MARATNEKGEKNKKTTAEEIPGKEKSKDRREKSLPMNRENDESDPKSNRDQPKAEKQRRTENDNKDKGKEKPKKKNEEKSSKRWFSPDLQSRRALALLLPEPFLLFAEAPI